MNNNISNKLGIAGFVISLISFLFFWIPFFGVFLLFIGLCLSIYSITKNSTVLALAGLVINIVLLLFAIGITFNFIFTHSSVSDFNSDNNLISSIKESNTKTNLILGDTNFQKKELNDLSSVNINSGSNNSTNINNYKKDLISEYIISVFDSNVDIINIVEYNQKNKLVNFNILDQNIYVGLDLKNYSDANLNLKDATIYIYDNNSLNKAKSQKYYLSFIYDKYYPKCYGLLKYDAGFYCINDLLNYPITFEPVNWLSETDNLELKYGCEERLIYQEKNKKLFYCSYRPSYFDPEFIDTYSGKIELNTYDTDFVSLIFKNNSNYTQIFLDDKSRLLNFTCNVLKGKINGTDCVFLDFKLDFDTLINIFYRYYPKVVGKDDINNLVHFEVLDDLICFNCGDSVILYYDGKVGYYKKTVYDSYSYLPRKIGYEYYKFIFDDNYNLKIYDFKNKNYSYYEYESACDKFGGKQGSDLKYGSTCDFYGDLGVDFLLVVKSEDLFLDNFGLTINERRYLNYLEDYTGFNDFVFITKQLDSENYRFNDFGDSYFFVRLNEDNHYEVYVVFENKEFNLYVKSYQLL
jgi:hypothetical protein